MVCFWFNEKALVLHWFRLGSNKNKHWFYTDVGECLKKKLWLFNGFAQGPTKKLWFYNGFAQGKTKTVVLLRVNEKATALQGEPGTHRKSNGTAGRPARKMQGKRTTPTTRRPRNTHCSPHPSYRPPAADFSY